MNFYSITDCFRLFINFFQHKMVKSALFRRFRRPGNFLYFFEIGRPSALNTETLSFYDRNLPVIQNINTAGMINHCRNIGRNEILIFTKPYNQRIIFLCADNRIGIGIMHEYKRIRTIDYSKHLADGREKITVIKLFRQMGNDFAVRFRLEYMAFFQKIFFKSM